MVPNELGFAEFTECASVLAGACRRLGLVVPVFRTPPRRARLDRTVHRHRDGSVTVAVRLTGRPGVAVQADMVEGCVVANGCAPVVSDRVRRELWADLTNGSLAAVAETAGRLRAA